MRGQVIIESQLQQELILRIEGAHRTCQGLMQLPVTERVLTQKEVDAAGVDGRKATPKGKTWQQLGAILAAQPDGDEWLHEHLPAPARWAWRFIGRRDFEANRAALPGSR